MSALVVLSTAARDAAAAAGMAALLDYIDGAGAARIVVYGGTQPPSGGTATSPIATIPLVSPAGVVTGGRLDLTTTNVFGQRIAPGVATWVRLMRGDGLFVLDGAIGDDALFQLDKVDGQVGALIELTGGALHWY